MGLDNLTGGFGEYIRRFPPGLSIPLSYFIHAVIKLVILPITSQADNTFSAICLPITQTCLTSLLTRLPRLWTGHTATPAPKTASRCHSRRLTTLIPFTDLETSTIAPRRPEPCAKRPSLLSMDSASTYEFQPRERTTSQRKA